MAASVTLPTIFRRYEVSDLFVVDVYDDRLLLHRPHRRALILAVMAMALVLLALISIGTDRPWLLLASLPVGALLAVERLRKPLPAYLIDRHTRYLYRQSRPQHAHPTKPIALHMPDWLPLGNLADYQLVVRYEPLGDELTLTSLLEGPHRIALHRSPRPADHLRLRNLLVRLISIRFADATPELTVSQPVAEEAAS